jgi:shikimate dehydrogenase
MEPSSRCSREMPMTAISGSTRVAAVIGWPVEHSRSPQMLNAAFVASGIDAVLVPMGVAPDDLAATFAGLRAMHALGASVTVPHKVAVAALCDELSVAAKVIGAVNCLSFEHGRVVGYNTDEGGFVDALAAAGFSLSGKRAVILGAGGAARAVAYGLRAGRAVEVIARRDVEWATAWPWTAENLRDAFARADIVVDTTPVGLGGAEEESAFVDGLPLDALAPHAWVATLVYHRTPLLLERAKARGHTVLDGRAMLVHQGARAFTIWTGRPAPIEVMTHALESSLEGKAR